MSLDINFLAGGIAVCPLCIQAVAALASESAKGPAASAADAHPHWGYQGAGAPDNWGKLEPNFKVCELGMAQTPIDLKAGIAAETGGLAPAFKEMPLRIVNNGHTIQVNCAPGSLSRINGQTYELLQFHFHHPSEHLVSGRPFAMENHFVHRNAAGELAVIGVFIKRGAFNPALAPIFDAMPPSEAPEQPLAASIHPADLLPRDRAYYRYAGSLTTPPCSEGVLWTVFKEPIEASDDQIRQFAALFPVNARPVQPLNSRFLLESRL